MLYSEDTQENGGSTVLLIIIPNPMFYRMFSQYGDVEKILIFEKSRIWKAFVEMATEEGALKAQEGLNGITLQDGGVMNVYFSTFKTVTLVNNNSGGVDYRQLKQRMNNKSLSNLSVHSQPEVVNQPTNPGLAYYNQGQYPTVQQAYSVASDDHYLGINSANQLDEFKYMFESIHAEKKHLKSDQIRSRSTTQTDSTQSGRKKLRLRKDSVGASSSNLYDYHNISNGSIQVLQDEYKAKHKNLNHESSYQYSDTSMPLQIRLSTQEDDLFDLINSNVYENARDDAEEQNEETPHHEDREIMNAFSDKSHLGFMFSIPEVQLETSSPQAKQTKVRKLQDLKFSDMVSDTMSVQECCYVDPSNYVNPQFLIENQPSTVIYIRGLQSPNITSRHLFNLLSNCGNILVIIFIKHKHSALVQFQQLNYAQNAKDHLNNLPFFGSKLKIFYSNYQEIQLPLPHSSPLTQVFLPAIEQNRFGEGRNLVFNPPGQVLHISNIQKEATTNELYIKGLFSRVGHVLQIRFMHVQKSKHMALIKMASLEEALNAAAELHGQELFGRNINISFTKSKL